MYFVVAGRSYILVQILYTASKETFSVAITYTDLGSEKHQTKAEIKDAVRICEDIVGTYSTKIVSINVDNAARGVATEAAKRLKPEHGHPLTLRDPSHCVDLLSKDLAQTSVVKKVVDEAKEIHTLVRTDRIDSMRVEAQEDGELEESYVGMTLCETRMNLVDGYIQGAIKQSMFLHSLPRNAKWKAFISERKASDKVKYEETLARCLDSKR
jgi:hypothetical protein